MEKHILEYSKLKNRIKNNQDSEKIIKNLYEIADNFSYSTIGGFKKLLDVTFNRLYDSINFNIPKGMDFKKLCEENNVVLVPNHQSHADYVAINYMVIKHFNFPLYVAGGVNLDIFPIGKLFRGSGCFFIRRSFSNDINYKLTLEGYLSWLLTQGNTIEFFFEGGRSRTGKLRSPRYGLYQMLLEAHSEIPKEGRKKLLFVPVSINHEYVAEQKSMANELLGANKKKETPLQLLQLFKIFSYQFGNIHINVGNPVEVPDVTDIKDFELKKVTQNLAFKCFRRVGKNMVVTPTSLLALVMLEEPSGAMKWKDILARVRAILEYCERFKVPITSSLNKNSYKTTMERAMDILIGNKKIEIIGSPSQGHIFYSINPNARIELLYFKNTILHHFLIPWTITSAWIKIFNGSIKSVEEFKDFFLRSRNQLKYEFYLPTVMQFFHRAFKVVSHCIGRPITTFEQFFELSRREFYLIFAKVGVFSKAGSYIYEGYFLAAEGINSIPTDEEDKGFDFDTFSKSVRRVYEIEKKLGRIIRYNESYSKPVAQNALKYFENENLIKRDGGKYFIKDEKGLKDIIKRYEVDILEKLTFNISPQDY